MILSSIKTARPSGGLTWIMGLGLLLGLQAQGHAQSGTGSTETKIVESSEQGPDDKRTHDELSDRKLYSEVIFAEIFEKDIAKACNLLEQLLARKLDNADLSREAQSRYRRLMLGSGRFDRYLQHIHKILERKDLSKNARNYWTNLRKFLEGKWGQELRKRVQTYKIKLGEAKDESPETREMLRRKYLDSINSYITRGRWNSQGPETGPRPERTPEHSMRIRRAQELQSKIDKLEKAGRGKSKEAQALRMELRRVINEEDTPRRGNRGNLRRGMRMMGGFYNARRAIQESGNTKRLAEFDKLSREVSGLMFSGQSQKARELIKEAEKRFPELKQNRRR